MAIGLSVRANFKIKQSNLRAIDPETQKPFEIFPVDSNIFWGWNIFVCAGRWIISCDCHAGQKRQGSRDCDRGHQHQCRDRVHPSPANNLQWAVRQKILQNPSNKTLVQMRPLALPATILSNSFLNHYNIEKGLLVWEIGFFLFASPWRVSQNVPPPWCPCISPHIVALLCVSHVWDVCHVSYQDDNDKSLHG